jgi:hypothetical protein
MLKLFTVASTNELHGDYIHLTVYHILQKICIHKAKKNGTKFNKESFQQKICFLKEKNWNCFLRSGQYLKRTEKVAKYVKRTTLHTCGASVHLVSRSPKSCLL